MRWRSLLLSVGLVSCGLLCAAETPIPPAPTAWVTDTANFLSPATVSSLNTRLSVYQQANGHQLIVYIAPTTGGTPIEDWGVRAFKSWKVGRKGLDDGLALFIMAQDQKLRIEVGYGLEGVVPDAIASRVINEVMVPRIQSGDRDGAVTAGVDALIAAIGGKAGALPAQSAQDTAPPRDQRPAQSVSILRMVFYGIVGVLLLLFAITHPSLAFYFLASMLSGGGGRDGGGGGFGGGGFSGGGGRSGGGGASGSW